MRKIITIVIGLLAINGMLITAPHTRAAHSIDPAATPIRPTLTPAPTLASTPASTPSVPRAEAARSGKPPSLDGYVWQNGNPAAPLPGVDLHFGNSGFDVPGQADPTGYYSFEQLGEDVGFLNASAVGGWQSTVSNIAVAPIPGRSLRVNLAMHQSPVQVSDVKLSLSVFPGRVGAGQTITFTIEGKQIGANKISGVFITDLLPTGLTLQGATTTRGDTLQRGNYAMADVGDMAPGDVVDFTLIATADNSASLETRLSDVASLMYREGTAIQASISANLIGGASLLPTTGIGWLPWLGLLLALLLVVAHQIRSRLKSTVLDPKSSTDLD